VHQVGFYYTDVSICTVNKTKQKMNQCFKNIGYK